MTPTPRPWNWWRLLPLDTCLAAAVMAAAVAWCAAQVPALLDKVRLHEALALQTSARTDAAEAYAVTGSLEAALPAQGDTEPRGRFGQDRRGGHSVASGGVGRDAAPAPAFELAFTPAVDTRALGWSMAWLCGHRAPPPGWTAPLPPVRVKHLSEAQLPLPCRDAPPPFPTPDRTKR